MPTKPTNNGSSTQKPEAAVRSRKTTKAKTSAKVPKAKAGEVAVADTRRLMTLGFKSDVYNPDVLVARKGYVVYDGMRRDDQVKACLMLKKAAIVGPGWKLEPASDDDAADQLADEVTDLLQSVPGTFQSKLFDMLSALDYGFCLHGDTVIHTPSGDVPIRDLVGQQPWVFACQGGRTVLARAAKVWRTKEDAECVRVRYSWMAGAGRGRTRRTGEIICTPEHPFLLRDGTYRKAAELQPNDRLMPFAQTTKRIGPGKQPRVFVQMQPKGGNGRGSTVQHAEWMNRARFVNEQLEGPLRRGQHVHHRDEDTLNDAPENLQRLDGRDHVGGHSRQWHARATPQERQQRGERIWAGRDRVAFGEKMSAVNRQTWADPAIRARRSAAISAARRQDVENHRIVSVEPAGRHDVYDMEVPGPHNFAANTVFVHNSITEIVWDLGGDVVGIKDLKTRAPHDLTFRQDAYGNIESIRQDGVGTPIEVPPDKVLHLIYRGEFSNPYGQSDLNEVHKWWWMKSNFSQWWAVFAEKLADPPVVGKHPPTAGKAQVDEVLEVLKRLQARTALTVPDGWQIDLMDAKRDPRIFFESALNWFNASIARGILVPDKLGYAGVESSGGGSYAMAQTQLGAFFFILQMLAQWLEALVQSLVDRLVAYNYGEVEAPKFKILPLSEENKERIATLWVQAVTAGAVMSALDDENHFRSLLGFPEVEKAERQRLEAENQKKQMDMFKAQAALAPKPAFPKPGGNGGAPKPTTPKESQPQKPPPTGSNKVAASEGWRPLTKPEQRTDLAEKRLAYAELTTPLAQALAEATESIVADLRASARTISEPEDIGKLRLSQETAATVRQQIAAALRAAYARGADQAQEEIQTARDEFRALHSESLDVLSRTALKRLWELLLHTPMEVTPEMVKPRDGRGRFARR